MIRSCLVSNSPTTNTNNPSYTNQQLEKSGNSLAWQGCNTDSTDIVRFYLLKLPYFQGQVEAAEQPEQASEARPGGGDRPDHHRVRLHPLPQPQVRHQHGGAVRRGRG